MDWYDMEGGPPDGLAGESVTASSGPPDGLAGEPVPKKKGTFSAWDKDVESAKDFLKGAAKRAKWTGAGVKRAGEGAKGFVFRMGGGKEWADESDAKARAMKKAEVESGDDNSIVSWGDVGTTLPLIAAGSLTRKALAKKGIDVGSTLLRRGLANAVESGVGTMVTTPGDMAERGKHAAIAGGTAPLMDLGIAGAANAAPGVKKFIQWITGMDSGAKEKAARRIAYETALNKTHGTDLKLSLGQLTDAKGVKALESVSEYFPLGLSKARSEGNEQTLKMLKSRAARSAAERDATKFRNVEDIFDDIANPEAVVGDKNAARILQESVEPSGTNNEKILAASTDVNMYPLRKRNNELYRMAGEEGDVLGPISMEGEPERLTGLAAGLERRLGKDSTSVGTARALAEDMSRAQGELFPSPNAVWETGAGRQMPTKPDIYGGVEESPELWGKIPNFREMGKYRSGTQKPVDPLKSETGEWSDFVIPQPGMEPAIPPVSTGGRYTFAGNTNPASDSKDLNVANILKSISALKEEAAALRRADKSGLAGEIDQIVTGMDTRLQQAASRNPDVRATLDAAALDYKQSVLPAERAGTGTVLHDANGRAINVPEPVALEDKGMAAVRNMADEEALRSGQKFGDKQLDIVDSERAATSLGNESLDQYFQGASAEERRMLLEILRATPENARVAKNPTTGHRQMFMEPIRAGLGLAGGLLGMGTGGASAAPLAIGPAARGLFNTEFGRRFFLNNPKFMAARTGSLPPWLANLYAQKYEQEGE